MYIGPALMLPIGMQSGGQNTAIFILYRLQYHCPSAIAEQDTGRAIIPIHDAAHGFRAANERAVGHSAPDHIVGNGKGVEEAGANGWKVDCDSIRSPQARKSGVEG